MADLQPGNPARGSVTGRPVMVLLDALGRRGALRIVWELSESGPLNFRALQAACGASSSVLNTRLTELRSLGLVTHEPSGYSLTPQGWSLTTLLGPLDRWAEAWAKDLKT